MPSLQTAEAPAGYCCTVGCTGNTSKTFVVGVGWGDMKRLVNVGIAVCELLIGTLVIVSVGVRLESFALTVDDAERLAVSTI